VLTSLRAHFVFPVDAPPIEHGVVTFEDDRIVAVGLEPPDNHGEIQDLGSVALLPGLVNAHTHLEFSDLLRPLGKPGMPMVEWIRLVIAQRSRRTHDAVNAIAAGLHKGLQHGVTTIGEIATANTTVAYNEADATVFLEVIGFSRARAGSAAAAVAAQLEEHDRRGGPRAGLSPHAPCTVSPELLHQLIGLACERNLPVAMHVAESEEEIELLQSGGGAFKHLLEERSMWDAAAIPRGSRPLDYLQQLANAPRALVIHGNYLDDEERAFLASHRNRMSLVYCPRTHAYFAHRPCPLAELLTAGVHVALGTDSCASNPDLDLLNEMRHVAKTHASIDPQEIVRLGTLAGAVALGRDNDVGSLTPGKLANLIALPVSDDSANSARDVLEELFANELSPSAVWFRGRKVERK
jgi:cytosine/adenosine deaminase-related metal-dependent hydrolase